MKMHKAYGVSVNGSPKLDCVFFNKEDRNEMALALYEEMIYSIWLLLLNWYDENDIQEAKGLALEHLFIYDTVIVED